MTRTEPTGHDYRQALSEVRTVRPHAAAAIATHVDHLQRLLARAQSDHVALQARVKQLAALRSRTEPSADQPLLLVDGRQTPSGTTTPGDIVTAAMALVPALFQTRPDNLGAAITEATVLHGPVAEAVLSVALRLTVEEMQPIVETIRKTLGQDDKWPWA